MITFSIKQHACAHSNNVIYNYILSELNLMSMVKRTSNAQRRYDIHDTITVTP